ncbi:beta-ketoacyl-ACP synthase [Limoniibacter endophyticus]|uniref:Beta-ketoacyl-ACP synthase II n=1 Tax=Limoniibacter endophyticus TaxID=1565040 RepID=A0A8J3DL91_9HYPH|nr:beta-ketoacyl-ACP synthase [Limoniibacter endophyticus]GHC60804.1 beta-ketoacyl-ACP synthase II [Limoniibacter endophyticus]
MSERDVVITGIGLASSLGEGVDAHWQALNEPSSALRTDRDRYAPYTIHPLVEIDWSQQIPKRGDLRQMENWQRLGTYTAGLALDDAGMKGDEALCSTMDMIVAAAGGERDEAVDLSIMDAALSRNDYGLLLNEKLTTELRPTLFLAQLSNLMAGNISIVHKVTGSSRTFMGEEGSGVSAVSTAAARIRSGQSSHVLVGGAFHTEHTDMLLGYELARYLHRGDYCSVWEREGQPGGGIVSGSGAAFLVLESREHAHRRGAKIYATLASVEGARSARGNAQLSDKLAALFAKVAGDLKPDAVISGASGAHEATAAEAKVLKAIDAPFRGFSTLTGHLKEAQFPFAVALAALSLSNGKAYPALSAAEATAEKSPNAILATAVGYHRYEGAALVTVA